MLDSHHIAPHDPNYTDCPINSYVVFTVPNGQSDELELKHKGPYQVVNKLDSIYTIQDLVDGKFITTHINNLRVLDGMDHLLRPLGALLVPHYSRSSCQVLTDDGCLGATEVRRYGRAVVNLQLDLAGRDRVLIQLWVFVVIIIDVFCTLLIWRRCASGSNCRLDACASRGAWCRGRCEAAPSCSNGSPG